MANNLVTNLPGLDRAIAALTAAGAIVRRSVRTGWDVTIPAKQWRRESLGPFEVIDLARALMTKEPEEINGK